MIETLIAVIPLMLSPGPANLVSFVLGTRNSISQLLPFHLGILFIYGIVAVALGLLAKGIGEFAPSSIVILQVIGGLFIIYLGIQLSRRAQRDAEIRAPTFLNGLTLQCLNPKYPGVVLAVVANRNSQPTLIVVAIICLVGAVGLLAYSAAGSLLRPRYVSDRRFAAVDIVSGVMLCAVGLWFILQALLST